MISNSLLTPGSLLTEPAHQDVEFDPSLEPPIGVSTVLQALDEDEEDSEAVSLSASLATVLNMTTSKQQTAKSLNNLRHVSAVI